MRWRRRIGFYSRLLCWLRIHRPIYSRDQNRWICLTCGRPMEHDEDR